ncbi:MAG: Flp pilus assembly protein CpaB [Aeromicrobium sp.]
MGRRTVLLIVAALIAALGSAMVFLYVRGADDRATEAQAPVQVLKAVAQITPGETLDQAQAAGKLELGSVPRAQVLPGAVNSIEGIGSQVALSSVFPNEQIISGKFGSQGDQELLTLPDGQIAISVTLSDTGRVAGFVVPGDEVAIFLNGEIGGGNTGVRLLLPRVKVIAIGSTTVISTTTTNPEGAQTTEQLPRTLFTLAVEQKDAEKIMLAATTGELSFGYLNDKSEVKPGPGTTTDTLFR